LRALDNHLDCNEFVCAGRFTAADVSIGYALLLAQRIGLEASFKPRVRAYWSRLQRQDGFLRAMAAQDRAALEQGVPKTHVAMAMGPF